MSTRATITVSDEHDRFHIYQHHDGYPDGPHGIIHHLNRARRRAWDLPRFEAADFSAAIVAALKDRGGSTYLTTDAAAHGDRSYHYEISPLRDATRTSVQIVIRQSSFDGSMRDIFSGPVEEAVTAYQAGTAETFVDPVIDHLHQIVRSIDHIVDDLGQDQMSAIATDPACIENIRDAAFLAEELCALHAEAAPFSALEKVAAALDGPDEHKGDTPTKLDAVAANAIKPALQAWRRFRDLAG